MKRRMSVLILSGCVGWGCGHWGKTGADDGGELATDDVAGDGTDDLGPRRYTTTRIEAQTFEMGCTTAQQADCSTNEVEPHEVTLTRAYKIDITEVTFEEYDRLLEGDLPVYTSGCGENCPVQFVSWHMAAIYANARSAEDGLLAFYSCEGEGPDLDCSLSGDPYESASWRLPTEAEWEAAARCGTDLKYAGSDTLDEVGWYDDNSESKTHPVGERGANGCDLRDMSGNVWEWVGDWGESSYDSAAVINPAGPSRGSFRALRGGSFGGGAPLARVSARLGFDPDARLSDLGFRLVRSD